MTWQLSQIFMPDSNIRNAMIYFKEVFLRKPSMEERQECVEFADSVMPIAMGRVYAEYVLPEGYKVSYLYYTTGIMKSTEVQNPRCCVGCQDVRVHTHVWLYMRMHYCL